MATKTKPKPKKAEAKVQPTPDAPETQERGSWSRNNLPAQRGKYTSEMKEALVAAVKRADAKGQPRTVVYTRLAKTWAKKYGDTFTEHQVSSQFHLNKARFGYAPKAQPAVVDAVTAPTATSTKPAAKPKVAKAAKPKARPLPAPLMELKELLEDMQKQLLDARTAEREAAKRAVESERALERIRKALH